MDFRSIYAHGFVRVAACTAPTAIADPARNAAAILAAAPAAREGVGLAVFPELCLSGYALEDLLLQDALLERPWRPRSTRSSPARATCCRCCSSARRCATATASTIAPWWSTAAACSASCRRCYLPNYREFYEQRHFASGAGLRGETAVGSAAARGPFGTDLLFAAEDLPGFVLHVEICEDLWVPEPPSARWRAGGRHRAGQPVGQPTSRSARPRRASCCAGRSRRAASPPTSTPPPAPANRPPTSPGTARPRSTRTARAGRGRALPAAAQRWSPTSTSTCCGRSGCARARSTTTRAPGCPTAFRTVPFRLDPPAGDIGLRRRVERFPFVPADPRGWSRIATRPTTSRCPGWSSGSTPSA